VEQGEQEVLHARVSVGQTPGATQRCPIRESARALAIRDPQAEIRLRGCETKVKRYSMNCYCGVAAKTTVASPRP
jgi:hypothetical protein